MVTRVVVTGMVKGFESCDEGYGDGNGVTR